MPKKGAKIPSEVTTTANNEQAEKTHCLGNSASSENIAEGKNEKEVGSSEEKKIQSELEKKEEKKKEKTPKPNICDVFMQANVTLQELCNSYSKIYKSFKESKLTIEKQKAEIKALKDDINDIKEMYEASKEREKSYLNKNLFLENKNSENLEIIRDKNNLIAEKDSEIDGFKKELAGRENMIDIMNRDGSKQVEERMLKLASALNQDYHDYLECKDGEISEELGELFRIQLGNLFDLLKKEGIPLE